MQSYVRNNVALQREKPANDFFAPVAKPKQWHPAFKMLKDNGFFYAAKKVIEELSAHLQSSVFKLSKDLIDSIHEEGIVAYTS